MEVLGLWRHAVKSLQGERLESARFEDDGLVGDRRWGIRDLRTGRILTARRRPELLGAVASYDGELPAITLPSGCTVVGPGKGTDGILSRWLGAVVLLPLEPCVRCTMVTRAQPGLDADVDVFRTLARHHRGLFGVWCDVLTGGTLSVGEEAIVGARRPVEDGTRR